MKEYLIWSEEHAMWWRGGSMGYTSSIRGAGRYNEAIAKEIVKQANIGGFNEIAIPVPHGLP